MTCKPASGKNAKMKEILFQTADYQFTINCIKAHIIRVVVDVSHKFLKIYLCYFCRVHSYVDHERRVVVLYTSYLLQKELFF